MCSNLSNFNYKPQTESRQRHLALYRVSQKSRTIQVSTENAFIDYSHNRCSNCASTAGVANRGALRQIWRIACLEVAHSRFKIFRAIWVSVLSSGRKICHSNNISKKKKKKVRTWLASRLVAYLSQK